MAMARENQGLQIALIVFVMLTVALGASTYWVYRLYDEQADKAKTALAEVAKERATVAKNTTEIENLKGLIGAAKTDSYETVKAAFDEDMKKYAATYPEESRFYRPLVDKMDKTIRERTNALADARAEIPRLTEEFKKREAARDLQVKQFEERAAKADKDLANEKSKFKTERERLTQDQAKLHADLQAVRKSSSESIAQIEAKLIYATQQNKSLLNTNEDLTRTIEQYRGEKMGTPNGEITWVNQRNATVWINLGRADSLMRQVTFGVYAAGSTDVKESKASIEVTHILGDHLAEARILSDTMGNPIIPGDRIFTPLWNSGERRHFALVGLMDLNGDGHSDLDTVIQLIESGGGVVDCYVADSGKNKHKIQGEITVKTNLLIVGTPADERSDPAQRDAFTRILRDADQFRLPKAQLGDFLQRVGWKNMSPVVHYGRGGNPNDFRAQPEDGVVRKSRGNVSDVFKDREPPAPSRPGRYYKF